MLPLTGYTDRLSATSGGRIAFKISSTFKTDYTVDVVRIRHGDPNPAGPGLRYIDVPEFGSRTQPSRFQETHLGSYATIPAHPAIAGLESFTVGAVIWPTLPNQGDQAILANLSLDGTAGFALEIGPEGAVVRLACDEPNPIRLATGRCFRTRSWYRIWASFDAVTGRLEVGQEPLSPAELTDDTGTAEASVSGAHPGNDNGLLIAARPSLRTSGSHVTGHYNGKIERPFLLDQATPLDGAVEGVVAIWDFSLDIPTATVRDTGANRIDGTLVNLPARGMTGSNWTGEVMSWQQRPEHYGAIHFHEDDLYDCEWETDFELEVPAGTKSGAYGARLTCEDVEEIIPFYVRPETGKPTADVLFLASTFTYQVYGNHARGNSEHEMRQRVRDWGARPWNPDDHHDYAHSTYNFHTDGSGVHFSSRLRPLITFRPNYLTLFDHRGSGIRHFTPDTHILDWLEEKGHDFDVITDEDLDEVGPELLASYKVVMTGSHPEYHTLTTRDSLQAYTETGGRFMYMGGNGFYWKVVRSPEFPGMIELRRTEGGIRTWAAEPGEYYHQLNGTYAGLWRRNGRYPNTLAGIGFSSQGNFESSYYRRGADAENPRAAWILAGIDDEVLGNFGLCGGGAAGFELDRFDPKLGSPGHGLVVLTSENHQESFIAVLEDQLSHRFTLTGETHKQLVRADVTFFETAMGGAVFSVGSITFSGSLSHNDYDNNISRMINNVVTRFRDSAEF